MAHNKSSLQCQVCAGALTRASAEFVSEETFAFLPALPAGILAGAYCFSCFESRVRQELDQYLEHVARARDVNVFFSTQGKESRFIRRAEKPVHVRDCVDRDEAVMRLAFLAVLVDKNTLVDVELASSKVHNGKWKSSLWSARGIPATVSDSALNRRFVGAPN